MEVNDEPRDSTDPVLDASPSPNPEPELKEEPTAEESAPSNFDGASRPIAISPEDGPGSDKESQRDSPRREQVGKAGAEEESFPVEETLEPREMDDTPVAKPPTLDASPEAEERVTVAEYHAPTPEGYVTPTGVLSTTGFPMRSRASPKRKQLSSLEGSEIAAGLVSAVKWHCGSASGFVPSSRLPGRMPYGLPSRVDGEESGIMGRRDSQSSTSERDEAPGTPPTTPVHTAHSSGVSQEEEPGDFIFATPPEGNEPSGTPTDSPAKGKEDTNGNFLGPLDELAAPPNHPAPAGSSAGAKPSPPAGPEALNGDRQPPVGNEGEPPSGPEPVAFSMQPASPMTEREDSPTIPQFRFTQALNLSTDSRRDDFESPNGEVTRPYQRYLKKTSMRATDWTYYHAQDEADLTEYHPRSQRGVSPRRGSHPCPLHTWGELCGGK